MELFPRKISQGQWIKTIPFPLPMYYNDSSQGDSDVCFDLGGNFLRKGSTDETVCFLPKSL